MRRKFKQAFFDEFRIGLDLYLKGEFKQAYKILKKVPEIKGTPDGPTKALMEYITSCNMKKPDGWNGFRELIEK